MAFGGSWIRFFQSKEHIFELISSVNDEFVFSQLVRMPINFIFFDDFFSIALNFDFHVFHCLAVYFCSQWRKQRQFVGVNGLLLIRKDWRKLWKMSLIPIIIKNLWNTRLNYFYLGSFSFIWHFCIFFTVLSSLRMRIHRYFIIFYFNFGLKLIIEIYVFRFL